MIPTDEQVEAAARIIEPQAWRALGMCDTLAYENRRKSSLRKARAALSAVLPQAVAAEREVCAQIADECDRQDGIDNGLAATGAAEKVAAVIRERG